MSDLNIISQGQLALQQVQSKTVLSGTNKNTADEQNNFAALTASQLKDPSFTDALQKRKIRETAEDFEAQFLSQMLQPMFEGLETDGPFGGGHAEKMWQSMLVSEYGKSIVKSGGIGLADEVQKQLLRAQEGK
jgi:peptidoglycan hydrolase FlgJ